MSEPSVEEIVAEFEAWPKTGTSPRIGVAPALAALIADWRKRGEALEMALKRDQIISELSEAPDSIRDGLKTACIVELWDAVDGLESDLDAALDVLWRRGDAESKNWIALNYSKFAAKRRGGSS